MFDARAQQAQLIHFQKAFLGTLFSQKESANFLTKTVTSMKQISTNLTLVSTNNAYQLR